jgi:hypothetical protein
MMNSHRTLVTRQRFYHFCLLVASLVALYMMAYGARIQSGDTLRLFDTASSMARYGDELRDETAWFIPPRDYQHRQLFPLDAEESSEPLARDILALYYSMVDVLPQVGMVHGVWTFNVLITALTAGLLYWIVLTLGYANKTALLAALMFGALTSALPYTKTLFREPLVMFLLTSVLWFTLLARRVDWTKSFAWSRAGQFTLWLALALLMFYMATLTKMSSILALPALLLLLLPRSWFRWRYISLVVLLIGLILVVILAYVPTAFDILWQIFGDLLQRMGATPDYAQPALHAYLFSLGGSIWGTSPILLLGIAGSIYLWRQSQQSLVWFVLVGLLTYAVGHALLTGEHWFGGVSWPPRFLIPMLPWMMLLVVPVVDAVLRQTSKTRQFILLVGVMILGLYSAWIQYSAVILPWSHYPDLLPLEAGKLIEWTGGLNDLRFLRWVLLPSSVGQLGFDIAWYRANIIYWLILYALAFIVLLLAMRHLLRIAKPSLAWLILPAMLPIMLWLSLTDVYHNDPDYLAQDQALYEVIDILHEERAYVPLFILDRLHSQFFMNYHQSITQRPISLPPQWGEPSDVPESDLVTSSNTVSLLDYRTVRQFAHVSQKFDHFWLLTDISPFMAGTTQAVERYLTERFYLTQSYTTSDPNVRLLRFDTHLAPHDDLFMRYDEQVSMVYDESVMLEGVYLPSGMQYQAGDVLPISFYWRALSQTQHNYTVAFFLAHSDGAVMPLQGHDSPPQNGFSPTLSWQAGQTYWDNRALFIPSDFPMGEYQIWVVLYHNTPEGIRRANITQGDFREDNIGVLPLVIKIG